jgi:hypothetical protein
MTIAIKDLSYNALRAVATRAGFKSSKPPKRAELEAFMLCVERANKPKRPYRNCTRTATAARREATQAAVVEMLRRVDAVGAAVTTSEAYRYLKDEVGTVSDLRWVDVDRALKAVGRKLFLPSVDIGRRTRYVGLER